MIRKDQGTGTPPYVSTLPANPRVGDLFPQVIEWSPRDSIRVDRNFDHEYTSTPTPTTTPDQPYALHLADRRGRVWLVGADFDSKRGDSHADATHLSEWLAVRDIPHLLCASGGGGHHLWLRLRSPIPADRARDLARRLADRYPSFDPTPMSNPRTGCLRAPGSPHRRGGVSTPLATAGREPADAITWAGHGEHASVVDDLLAHLRRTTPKSANTTPTNANPGSPARPTRHLSVLPGHRRPLPPEIIELAHTPIVTGADASAIAWRILLSAAHARWTLDEVTAAAIDERWPGLEHLRSRPNLRGGRSLRRNPARHVHRQWMRAVAVADAANTDDRPEAGERQHDHALRLASAVLAAADAEPTMQGCNAAITRRCVLDALCTLIVDTGCTAVDLDVRRWADTVGISKSAISRHVHELRTQGWIVQTSRSEGTRSATYTVRVPVDGVTSGTQEFPPPDSPTLTSAATRVRSLRADTWTHHRLGKAAGLVHHVLVSGAVQSLQEIAAVTGLSLDRIEVLLSRLRAAGLVARSGFRAFTSSRCFVQAARWLGVHGVLESRRTRYQHESTVWAWWCDESEWRAAPRNSKPNGAVRARFGPFPLGKDGRACWTTALTRVITAATASSAV